ncbi:MAG: hypothetical protein AB1861_14590 [Cyanobacteriota bacterium]
MKKPVLPNKTGFCVVRSKNSVAIAKQVRRISSQGMDISIPSPQT